MVAPPSGSSNTTTPTGIVAPPPNVNFNVGGAPSIFIFDTEDGTISGWTGAQSTIIAVENSKVPSAASGAVYKGLAFLQNTTGNFLLGTNFRSGKVEIYDRNFHQTQALGASAFNDPALPAVPAGWGSPRYAPFGIHTMTLNGQPMVLVTYALQDNSMHDPLHIAGSGVVDLFNEDGSMNRRVTADAHLNAPWGAVVPPPGFGAFAGDLLIGNFGDGTISVYNPTSGNFIGLMKDGNGAVLTKLSLRQLLERSRQWHSARQHDGDDHWDLGQSLPLNLSHSHRAVTEGVATLGPPVPLSAAVKRPREGRSSPPDGRNRKPKAHRS